MRQSQCRNAGRHCGNQGANLIARCSAELSVYEVKEILGHSDIKTTLRYAHLESRQVTSKARDVINQLN
jgi:integrase